MNTVSGMPSTKAKPPTPSLPLASEANVMAPMAPTPMGRREEDNGAPPFCSRTERATASISRSSSSRRPLGCSRRARGRKRRLLACRWCALTSA
eukprot:3000170-Prymnesium_polylepis.1